jgi:hypothetical protein
VPATTDWLHLRRHKTASGCEVRILYCLWLQESVFDVYLDQELAFCSDEAEFIPTRYVKMQNGICLSTDSAFAVLEALLYGFRVGVWCAVSVCNIME